MRSKIDMEQPKNDQKDSLLDDIASKDIHVSNGHLELVDETPDERRRHWLRRRTTLFSFSILIILIAGWLVAGFYLPKAKIGDQIIAVHQSDQALESQFKDSVAKYKLAVAYPDGSQKDYSLQDIGFEPDYAATIAELRNRQHQWSNRLQWWRPIVINLALTNKMDANKFIAKNATITIQPPTDAKLSLKKGKVVVANSVAGQHYGLVDPMATLINAVSSLQSKSVKLVTLSTRPAVASEQLAPYQQKLESILGQDVQFTIEGRLIRPSTSDIGNWVEITPKLIGKGLNITVNSGKVLAYINKITAGYVNPGRAQVEFEREDGTTAVLVSGAIGTDVSNKSTIAKDVAANLLDNKPIDSELEIKRAGFKTVTAQDYKKWIEVNVTTKKMFLYEKSKLVKTYLISAGAPDTPTVLGDYQIFTKFVQQDMSGFNVDGSEYFQPHVAWVNYFYAGYAIHGNYWRPLSWFGNYNSSHGCVSLPDNLAQQVYNWAPIGTHVIIHT